MSDIAYQIYDKAISKVLDFDLPGNGILIECECVCYATTYQRYYVYVSQYNNPDSDVYDITAEVKQLLGDTKQGDSVYIAGGQHNGATVIAYAIAREIFHESKPNPDHFRYRRSFEEGV